MEKELFISYVESTQGAFRRFLVALCCGDKALADDIAQESYIKAYLACESISSHEKFRAWIFRIGYNTFIDHKRSVRVFENAAQARDITATEKADSGFRYQELYEALNNLPVRERTAILLHYIEGYPIKEIAEIIEVSQDAIKQYLSRGRSHLRYLLSES